jgi:RNA polymerase sigma-70 factor (ECF subfamily)
MENREADWVREARTGDRAASAAAFSKLVEAYQAPVYNLAYRMLGNPAEAEDAAQETFIRAYTRLGTYDPTRKFSSWLLAIASHYCVDVLRRRRLQTLPLDDLPPMVELATPRSAQPEQVVVSQQDASAVQKLLNVLSPPYRTPVVLRYWYDMSYREIAETMGVPISTVKARG